MPLHRIGAGGPFLVAPEEGSPAAAVVGGMIALAFAQIILVEAEPDPPRVDHNRALFFNRSTATTVTSQPLLALPASRGVDQGEPDDAARPNQHLLHRHRTGYQTVGQSYRLWPKPAVADQTIEDEQRTNQTLLQRYRTGFQTVGQPTSLLRWQATRAEEPEAYDVKSARPDLHLYRQAFQTVGQNYRLWPAPAKGDQTVEPEQRVEQHTLHRFRTGYQTVGQPFALWPGPQKRLDAEDHTGSKPVDLTPYRSALASTAGPSWQYWLKPHPRLDEESYVVPGPASLAPFRQVTVTAQPGQPWWLWPRALADQATEPHPVVTDHADALFALRQQTVVPPPDVVVPPVTNGDGVGGGSSYTFKPHVTRRSGSDKPDELNDGDLTDDDLFYIALALVLNGAFDPL